LPIVARLADARGVASRAEPLVADPAWISREETDRRAQVWCEVAARIVVPAEHVRTVIEWMRPDLANGRIRIIPPTAVPRDLPAVAPPAHPVLRAGGFLALIVDRDDPGDLAHALQALAILRFRSGAELPPVVAIGATDPALVAAYGSLFGLSGERLVALGDPPIAERLAVLREAALALVPDHYAAASPGIDQAVAAGAPLVCAWTEPSEESLRRLRATARHFTPGEPEAIAEAVERTLADPARPRALAAWARDHSPPADEEGVVDAWEGVLAEAAGGRPPEAPSRPRRTPPRGAAPGRRRIVVYLPSKGSLGGIRVAEGLVRALLERGGPARVAVAAPPAVVAEVSRRVGPVPTISYEEAQAWDRPARISCGPGDVVWSAWPHGTLPPETEDAALACTWHDFNFRRHSTLTRTFIRREEEVAPAWFTRCAVVIHSSRFIADEMRHFYPWAAERSRVVPLAVADAFRRPPREEALNALARLVLPERFLLVPAGYHPHKNQDRLLEAVEAVEPQPVLVFTGTMTWKLDGWAPWAIGLGIVGGEELRALYERSAGVVIPTLYEAGSFPIMEAMAVGRPAAGSLIPPIVEQIERIGAPMVGFDPLDLDSIAEAVARVWRGEASDPERLERAQTAVLARTWGDVADGYLEVLLPLTQPARRMASGTTVVPSRP
jgi:glycosyltransferase involved in cell wall biosynthesis